MKINKYSFGIGDRFSHEGIAQLKALDNAKKQGIEITPVWNKSNREHNIIHSTPEDTRRSADKSVKQFNWKGKYFVDADHINLSNVDKFIDSSDFFTIDVADYIGKKADNAFIEKFVQQNSNFIERLRIPGVSDNFKITGQELELIAGNYLFAILEAGKIYRHIEDRKGAENFITEISMDEVNDPQSPLELFFILSAISSEKIPLQTIAPKFTGRFNKGVDYIGNIEQFYKEFEEDLLVIDYAVKEFGLSENLKLSIHSGSDKFSIYPVMGKLIKKYNKGIHVKTAGTTWLEELIGLAIAGEEPLDLVKSIYSIALTRLDELCSPYASVIDIDRNKLPSSIEMLDWNGEKFANTLRHIPGNPDYNPNVRQLLHVGYKVAAEYGIEFISNIEKYSQVIGPQVTDNLYKRHIFRLFELEE